MTTTYEVLLDCGDVVTVAASEYYKREDGWVTFKDSGHKVIRDFPESVVRMISRVSDLDTNTLFIKATRPDLDDEALKRISESVARLQPYLKA